MEPGNVTLSILSTIVGDAWQKVMIHFPFVNIVNIQVCRWYGTLVCVIIQEIYDFTVCILMCTA